MNKQDTEKYIKKIKAMFTPDLINLAILLCLIEFKGSTQKTKLILAELEGRGVL